MHAQQPSSISHKLDMQHRENNVDIIKVHHMNLCKASGELRVSVSLDISIKPAAVSHFTNSIMLLSLVYEMQLL